MSLNSRVTTALVLLLTFDLGVSGKSRKEPQSVSSSATRVETRVYLRHQCLLGEEKVTPPPRLVAGLAAIFVPALIEKALGAVSATLKKAGQEETLRDLGQYPTYLYHLSY